MRNVNLVFGVIFCICLVVAMWLASPGTVKDFQYVTIEDLVLHEKILPNFSLLLGVIWLGVWFLIPQNFKKNHITPLAKLKPARHFMASTLILTGIILQYYFVTYPETIRQTQSLQPSKLALILVVTFGWVVTLIYYRLPLDYRKIILVVLSITMVILTILQVLTYFIML